MLDGILGAEILTATTLGLLGLGAVEHSLHRANLRAIPQRIHVNGTRGKSSVTRLIAAGLRAAGTVTCAKTTGTLPRFIDPQGGETPIFRPSRANIIEQKQVVAQARALGAQALVVECMALQPALQWVCENKLVRATHAVITNARPDHLDVMGPQADDVARALCGMVPVGGKVFTHMAEHHEIVAAACHDRGATLILTPASAQDDLSETVMQRFTYDEHRENVALALLVCQDLGVPRQVALDGMTAVQPDPGALSEHPIVFFGRDIVFVNGFAANDPVSTERIWRLMVETRHLHAAKRIAVFNCRADRAERSVQLGQCLVAWPQPHHVVLMGDGAYLFARAAVAAGFDARRFVWLGEARVEEIFETLISLVSSSALIMGLGNIGGQGLDLVRYFKNRSMPQAVLGA
jgi:poly-gamma-glutamate synthase PgsB/CapB